MTAIIEPFVDRDARTLSDPRPRAGEGDPATRVQGLGAAEGDFTKYAADARVKIEGALARWIAIKAAKNDGLPPSVRAPVDAAFELATRGGKRWRAVLVLSAYEAFGGEGGSETVLLAAVALELFQVYLLIHDDWMDGDELRRGGPSVPAMMRARFGKGELADASAILAGDYAAGLALEALLSVPCDAGRVARAARELARVEQEVVLGQLLDVHPDPDWPIETTHAMKTASYSVRAPVLIGARLAGAGDDACSALEAYAGPLGVAFQLRDDLLGTFGDSTSTGKPKTTDLRRGKRTALVAELEKDPASGDRLVALGKEAASQEELEALAAHMDASGARARVEARIDALLAQSRAALGAAALREIDSRVLSGAVQALGRRAH